MISDRPNSPMATGTKPTPSNRSSIPKVKRCSPVVTSVPISPTNTPSTIIAIAFTSDPWARTMAATSPSTITAT